MKRLLTLFWVCVLFANISIAQLGISTTGALPDSSAMLDVYSTNKGLLAPRMTAAQLALIPSPATGLLVYQLDGTPGYYYNSGTSRLPVWVRISSGTYAETDPVFGSSAVNRITGTDIANWNLAFAWGNHSGLYRDINWIPDWDHLTGKPSFSIVTTSGSYNDLTDKPTILNSQWRTVGDDIHFGELPVNAGRVGIGTSTPSYALDVVGSLNITGAFLVNGIPVSGTGTVTGIDVSGGNTGLTITGGPVTTNGTLTLGGTLGVANGGTNLTSYTFGDLIYASTSNSLSKLAGNTTTTKKFLTQTGTGSGTGTPSWGTVSTTDLLGTLSVTSGGTGTYTPPVQGGVIYANSTSTFSSTGVGTSGQVLTSNGTNAPTWANLATPPGVVQQFAGNTAPTGYLICDGAEIDRTTYAALFSVIGIIYGSGNGSTTFNLPNLQGRIPVGKRSSFGSFDALNETGGGETHSLKTTELAAHSHIVTPGDVISNEESDHIHDVNPPSGVTTSNGAHNHSGVGNYINGLLPANTGAITVYYEFGSTVMYQLYGGGQHNHTISIPSFTSGKGSAHTHKVEIPSSISGTVGSGAAFNILQPYIVLNYIIKY